MGQEGLATFGADPRNVIENGAPGLFASLGAMKLDCKAMRFVSGTNQHKELSGVLLEHDGIFLPLDKNPLGRARGFCIFTRFEAGFGKSDEVYGIDSVVLKCRTRRCQLSLAAIHHEQVGKITLFEAAPRTPT